jgi:hypothetical protein
VEFIQPLDRLGKLADVARPGAGDKPGLLGATPSARPEVVFGNLGPTGAGSLSSTQTDIGPSAATTEAIAIGFETGAFSTNPSLQSVTIGTFAASSGTLSRTISIYSNNAGLPGTSLFMSSVIQVGSNGKYPFDFSNVNLDTDSTCWIVPDFSVDWTWVQEAEDEVIPGQQNASWYTYVNRSRIQKSNPGVWANSGNSVYAISVTAVPEPSTVALTAAALGLGCFAALHRRRAAA